VIIKVVISLWMFYAFGTGIMLGYVVRILRVAHEERDRWL